MGRESRPHRCRRCRYINDEALLCCDITKRGNKTVKKLVHPDCHRLKRLSLSERETAAFFIHIVVSL